MEEEMRMTRSQVRDVFERWNAAAIKFGPPKTALARP